MPLLRTRPTHAAAAGLVEPFVKNQVSFRATWPHVLDPTEHGSQIAGYNVPVYASGTVESAGNRPIQRAYPRAMVRSRTQIIRHERGPGMVNVQIHRILRLASKETIFSRDKKSCAHLPVSFNRVPRATGTPC